MLYSSHLAGVSCNIPTGIRDSREGPQGTGGCSVDGGLEPSNNCAARIIVLSNDNNKNKNNRDIHDKHHWYVLESILMGAFNKEDI